MPRKKPTAPKKSVGQQVIDALNEFIESGELARVLEKLPPNSPKVTPKLCPPRPEEKKTRSGQFELAGREARRALREWAWQILRSSDEGEWDGFAEDAALSVMHDDVQGWGEVVAWMGHVVWAAKVRHGSALEVSALGFTELTCLHKQRLSLSAESCEHYDDGWLLNVGYDFGTAKPGTGIHELIKTVLALKGT